MCIFLVSQSYVGQATSTISLGQCTERSRYRKHILFFSLPPGEEVSGLYTFSQSHRAMPVKVNCPLFSFVLSFTQVCSVSPPYPKCPFSSPSKSPGILDTCYILSFPSRRSPRLKQSVPALSCRGSCEGLMQLKCVLLTGSVRLFLGLSSSGILQLLHCLLDLERDFGPCIIVKSLFFGGWRAWTLYALILLITLTLTVFLNKLFQEKCTFKERPSYEGVDKGVRKPF